MTSRFVKAERQASRLRLGIEGPSGSGKTYGALLIAQALAAHDGGRVAMIDSERGSSVTYSGGHPFDFDILELDDREPGTYIRAMLDAQREGYPVIVVDSASHEWKGVLGIVDRAQEQFKGNSWSAWSKGRPAHDAFVDTMTSLRAHVIMTFRSKQDTQQVRRDGKVVVEKLGMAPVTDAEMDYEFTVWGSLSHEDHGLEITKSRIETIAVGSRWPRCEGLAEAYIGWLGGATYASPHISDETLIAQLADAAREQNIGGDAVSRLVGKGAPAALAWLHAHADDVDALLGAVRAHEAEREAAAAPGSRVKPWAELSAIVEASARAQGFTTETLIRACAPMTVQAWLHAHDDDVAALMRHVAEVVEGEPVAP